MTLTVIAIVTVCLLVVWRLPVSLMPDIDIPHITVYSSLQGASVRDVEEKVSAPLRSQLMQVSGLKDIRSESRMDGGVIQLDFEPGSNMDIIFIEVNEKIDRAMSLMPNALDRPKVVKAGSMDIPAFYIDISLKNGGGGDEFVRLSDFVASVVRKRIEQLEPVAMTDISGLATSEIVLKPDYSRLSALGITTQDLENAIIKANISLEALSVVNGAYRYNLHFDSQLLTIDDVRGIYVKCGSRLLQLKDLCEISEEPVNNNGIVRHGKAKAVTLAVIKQNDARMEALRDGIDTLLGELRDTYPGVDFSVTRDQTRLLTYSIQNLGWNLLLGIVLACLMLLIFLRNPRVLLLIIISIPLTLLLTALCFYLLHISLNVISLSGLILGVGMMVDNSIIVIDNILRLRLEGKALDDAVVKGTSEVFTPMLSSVLTTCSVFIPLIFISGTAGALFYDQAMAVTISLFASLIIAVLIIPVYFKLLKPAVAPPKAKPAKGRRRINPYSATLSFVLRHSAITLCALAAIVAAAALLYPRMEKERLPKVAQTDMLVGIDWNAGITAQENDRRVAQMLDALTGVETSTAMVGSQGFVLSHTKDINTSEAILYINSGDTEKVGDIRRQISEFVAARYPKALVEFSASGNLYDLIFSTGEPNLEIRLQTTDGAMPSVTQARAFRDSLALHFPVITFQPVATDEVLHYVADVEKLALHGLSYAELHAKLSELVGSNRVFTINDGSRSLPIIIGGGSPERFSILAGTIRSAQGVDFPLGIFIRETRGEDFKRLHANTSGSYYPIRVFAPSREVERVLDHSKAMLDKPQSPLTATFGGDYFSSREMIFELALVLAVAVALLYFILAAQFENVVQPAIILSEVALDIAAVLVVLWALGESINIMTMIGIVVMSGIVINDSILKVDTINRLRRGGMPVLKAVIVGGHLRFKPIVMTSLTTIFAIVPFLSRGSMGSDLQYPLSLALIIGMVVGTLVSLFVVPLFYLIIYRKR